VRGRRRCFSSGYEGCAWSSLVRPWYSDDQNVFRSPSS
jgi:hypothetical protein